MNTTKPKINILLVGNSGVGKSSLCQAFSSNLGFSYGFGLSRRATVVEIGTDKCVYNIVDAPKLYEEGDSNSTYRNVAEISKILGLTTSGTPYVVCFVICLDDNGYVKQNDLGMMRIVKHCFEKQQTMLSSSNVKFSLIINRLSERGFTAVTENIQHRQSLLNVFRNEGAMAFTEDDILLINDSFLQFTKEQQQGLLTDYVKKFEAGHADAFGLLMQQFSQPSSAITGNYLSGYNQYEQQLQKQMESLLSNQSSSYLSTMAYFDQIQKQSEQQSQLLIQQIMGSASGAPGYGFGANPYMNSNIFDGGYTAPNPYLSSSINQQQQNYSAAFQQPYNQGFQQQNPSTTNQVFGAAGAFMNGYMGDSGTGSSDNSGMYNVAGQFVGGVAAASGCSIM